MVLSSLPRYVVMLLPFESDPLSVCLQLTNHVIGAGLECNCKCCDYLLIGLRILKNANAPLIMFLALQRHMLVINVYFFTENVVLLSIILVN